MKKKSKNTEAARKRYNHIAPFYDFMEGLIERSRYSRWREMLWSKVEGSEILEVGVGTGKNFPYYPVDKDITAIDFSEKMLHRAKKKAGDLGIRVHLEQMDVQNLEFEDNAFDTVVGSFVFCSVPDPIKGLQEVGHVCKPGGKIILLEHVLSANRVLSWLMNLVNPVVVGIMGPNINRRTVENVANSGLKVEKVTDLAAGIFKLIEARKEKPLNVD
jgi:phosphatidylethanolamine/phosphatidyl-N-methylethanolamine N-methyltransferase